MGEVTSTAQQALTHYDLKRGDRVGRERVAQRKDRSPTPPSRHGWGAR